MLQLIYLSVDVIYRNFRGDPQSHVECRDPVKNSHDRLVRPDMCKDGFQQSLLRQSPTLYSSLFAALSSALCRCQPCRDCGSWCFSNCRNRASLRTKTTIKTETRQPDIALWKHPAFLTSGRQCKTLATLQRPSSLKAHFELTVLLLLVAILLFSTGLKYRPDEERFK